MRRLKEEVGPRINPFGRISGFGVNHYLVKTWDEMLRCLEQDDAACGLVSIEFSKAFNSISHQSCLSALERGGASKRSVLMIRAFLTDCVLHFKVNDITSWTKNEGEDPPREQF